MSTGDRIPLSQRIVQVFLTGNLSILLVVVSLLLGVVALVATAREEDPQIVVPMVDVMLSVPGCSSDEVERQVTRQLEKFLYEIDGVEYVYSASESNKALVTARFYVGENREDSLFKVYNKIAMNADRVPPQVAGWVVKPVEIDDVPMFAVTLFGEDEVDDSILRRVAEEIESELKEVPNTGRTEVVGGRARKLLVHVDPHAAAAHGVGWGQLAMSLRAADVSLPAGGLDESGAAAVVEAGERLTSPREIEELIVGVHGGVPVYLRDVAKVTLGPDEPVSYTRIGFGPEADPEKVPEAFRGTDKDYPAVAIAVAKRKGSNAVWVADALLERLDEIQREALPDGVHWYVTRNYGETANHKVNELIEALAVAIVIVIALVAVALGWREGLIVATAVPITFGLTLFVNMLAGYTINRVTLFALILSLGLVVDDPIVDVENIYRHLRKGGKNPYKAVLDAVNEVRPPIILATMAIIVSFLPLFFISGMMGPYMAPLALNVPLSMLMSLVVAFTVTPWMSYHVLKGVANREEAEASPVLEESLVYRAYRATLGPFLKGRKACWALIAVTAFLFAASCWLGVERLVPLKMLPYDNKNEFQIVVDTPEGTTLERTEAITAELAAYLRQVPEVTDVTTFAGLASPMDFNGLVRHYFLRQGPHMADLRVGIVNKTERVHQSHELTLRLRNDLTEIGERNGARIKIVELPPGPPVLSTVVAEVYGRSYTPYAKIVKSARLVEDRLREEPGVVDVDAMLEDEQTRLRFVPDREKVRLTGLSEQQVAAAVRTALAGESVAVLHNGYDANPTPIELRLPRTARSNLDDLDAVSLVSQAGGVVRLSELGDWERGRRDQPIYRKNLRRVVFVTAEIAGRTPAEVVLDVQADRVTEFPLTLAESREPRPVGERDFLNSGSDLPWAVAPDMEVDWGGEGEWKITLDVFRDLGLAFAAACLGIYILLVYETKSYFLPLILMVSIPLTILGIMPGFWLLQAFSGGAIDGWANPTYFTATGMIGMIALSGLAVRNAILLIEFVHAALDEGKTLEVALIEGGAVRTRPIILTAGTAMLAAWPITLDPIFSGLAWALIFGLLVSTAFTLVIIPVIYYMVYKGRETPNVAAAAQLLVATAGAPADSSMTEEPKTEETPPKTEEAPPETEEAPPKTEETPPKTEETPPKTEGS